MRSVALVALDGTIDFLCLPEFDSPTVFAALLDAKRGGALTFDAGLTDTRTEQHYVRDTNVLVTRFSGAEGELELVDFMSLDGRSEASTIIRMIRCRRGAPRVAFRCSPRFDYARATHDVTLTDH